jgi:NitT/TauT family transport system substrate-binding protein
MTGRPPLACTIAIAAMALSAGCGAVGRAGASVLVAPEKPDLTVAVVPAVDSAGFFIALQRGLFAAQGLHIRYVPAVSSETVIGAQESGEYDITAGNYVSYIQADVSNPAAGLQIIDQGSTMQAGSQAIYVMPRSPITSIPGLQGARVAINAPGGIEFMLVASLLEDYGLPPTAVHFVSVDFQDTGQALATGQVDAAEMPQPFATELSDSLGLVELADANQSSTQNLPILGYVASRAWVRKYPRTLAAFNRALNQGQQIADNDIPAVRAAIEYFDGVSAVTAGGMAPNFYPTDLDQVQLQRVADLMYLYGLLKQPFNIGRMLG